MATGVVPVGHLALGLLAGWLDIEARYWALTSSNISGSWRDWPGNRCLRRYGERLRHGRGPICSRWEPTLDILSADWDLLICARGWIGCCFRLHARAGTRVRHACETRMSCW
jgi:hypothetical protein